MSAQKILDQCGEKQTENKKQNQSDRESKWVKLEYVSYVSDVKLVLGIYFRNTEFSTLNDSLYLNINQCDKTYLIPNNGNNKNNSNNNNNNNLIRCFKFVL